MCALECAERTEQAVRAAVGTDGTRLTEPNDHDVTGMLTYCRMRVEECRGSQSYPVHGGASPEDVSP